MTALAQLNSVISAESALFVRGIEDCRGSLKSLVASLDPVAAATARYNSGVDKLSVALKKGQIDTEQYGAYQSRLKARLEETIGVQNQMVSSSGRVRAGLQNAGFQVQDFAVQVAGGTSALRAATQQLPQFIGALAEMSGGATGATGALGKFLGFLGGPWGVVIATAVPIASIFASKLFGIGDDAEKAAPKVKTLAQQINALVTAQGNLNAEAASAVIGSKLTGEASVAQISKKIADLQAVRKALSGAGTADALPGVDKQIAALTAQKQAAQGGVEAANAALDIFNRQNDARLRGVSAQAAADAADKAATQSKKDLNTQLKEQKKLLEEIASFSSKQVGATNAIITSGKLTDFDTGAAAAAKASGSNGYKLGGADDPVKKQTDAMLAYREGLKTTSAESKKFWADIHEQAGKTQVAWQDAAKGILGSLNSVVNSLKSGGGILDVLTGVLDLFLQLGSIGTFGKTLSTNINASSVKGARASGGPVSGGDTYLVGENGPELFTPRVSGQIIANDNLKRGRVMTAYTGGAMAANIAGMERVTRIAVEASPYFDVTVDGRAQAVAVPIGIRAAQAGSGDAQRTLAKRRRNTMPGRF